MKLRDSNRAVRPGWCAFTLIEVILAISIAVGILVVALYFYSQTANLRGQLLEESDRIAAVRLVMDRLSTELRAAFAHPQYEFKGDATNLIFVTIDAPLRVPKLVPSSTLPSMPRSSLKLVNYGLATSIEGTNEIAMGLTRSEQPLLSKPSLPQSPVVPLSAAESTQTPVRKIEPMTDAIRFLQIRYWDSRKWSSTWNSRQLPRGVEITLGADPFPTEAPLTEYPSDLFRRVIYLPTSRALAETSIPSDPLELNSFPLNP